MQTLLVRKESQARYKKGLLQLLFRRIAYASNRSKIWREREARRGLKKGKGHSRASTLSRAGWLSGNVP
jgi:hypothetical protein